MAITHTVERDCEVRSEVEKKSLGIGTSVRVTLHAAPLPGDLGSFPPLFMFGRNKNVPTESTQT